MNDKQKNILSELEKIEWWQSLKVIKEWSKLQLENQSYYFGIDGRANLSKELNSEEFLIASIYKLLEDY